MLLTLYVQLPLPNTSTSYVEHLLQIKQPSGAEERRGSSLFRVGENCPISASASGSRAVRAALTPRRLQHRSKLASQRGPWRDRCRRRRGYRATGVRVVAASIDRSAQRDHLRATRASALRLAPHLSQITTKSQVVATQCQQVDRMRRPVPSSCICFAIEVA